MRIVYFILLIFFVSLSFELTLKVFECKEILLLESKQTLKPESNSGTTEWIANVKSIYPDFSGLKKGFTFLSSDF